MIFKEELDERIRDESDIQTRLRYDDELVGEMGYFSCGFADLSDLNNCHYDKLAEIDTGRGDDIFAPVNDDFMYAVFVPEKLLKHVEKKYRPYKTTQEFFDDTGLALGDIIHYRRKTDDIEYRSLIAGTSREIDGTETVFFCNEYYTLEELFNYCEVFVSDTWRPFGVLDE